MGPLGVVQYSLGGAWMLVALSKLSDPTGTQFTLVAGSMGVRPEIAGLVYWSLLIGESMLGAALLCRVAVGDAWVSFLLSGSFGLASLALEPLRGDCGCLGALTRSFAAKWVILGTLFVLSYFHLSALCRARRPAGPTVRSS